MADIKISELTSAATLNGTENAELSQSQSGQLVSVKATLQAIANWFATNSQYTSALQTTDKTLAGAINELKQLISLIPQFSIEVVEELPTEDISDTTIYLVPAEDPEVGNYYEEYIHVNNTWELVGTTAVDLSAYYTKLEVDGLLADKLEADDFEANKTASANPITLETKQAGLAKSCVVEMNPIQDLHGYSNPWAGGAGKNKLLFDIDAIKADNTSGTWTGNNYAIRNVTFAFNDDGTVLATRSATDEAASSVRLLKDLVLPAGTYVINGITGGSSSTYRIRYALNGGTYVNVYDGDSDNIVMNGTDTITVQLYVYGSYETPTGGITFEPMIRLSSVADSAFEPYSNICPISGRTEASVTRTGKNLFDKTTVTTGKFLSNTGAESTNANGSYSDYIPIKTNTPYYFSHIAGIGAFYSMCVYDSSKTFLENINIQGTGDASGTVTFTQGAYIRVNVYQARLDECQIELGSTATEYESYQTPETHTKEFGQTVYGGSLDFMNGGLDNEYELFEPTTVTTVAQSSGLWYWAFSLPKTSTNPLSTNGLMPSHFKATNQVLAIGNCYITANGTLLLCVPSDQTLNTGALVNAWLAENDLQFAYKPATPTTIQLSPEAVTLLKGQNVISTDGDKVQVEFSDIPVGDYSTLLDYIKSLEARIEALEEA